MATPQLLLISYNTSHILKIHEEATKSGSPLAKVMVVPNYCLARTFMPNEIRTSRLSSACS